MTKVSVFCCVCVAKNYFDSIDGWALIRMRGSCKVVMIRSYRRRGRSDVALPTSFFSLFSTFPFVSVHNMQQNLIQLDFFFKKKLFLLSLTYVGRP